MSTPEVVQQGRYRYVDHRGAVPVIVVVMEEDGVPVACFPPDGFDEGAHVPLAALAGTLEGPLP